ncbi:MAG: maleylpyruvate isomerase N-terminal domain-containing protein [Candidatus Nanopelagicales bacterium]
MSEPGTQPSAQASIDGTRLSVAAYLEHLDTDVEALLASATDLDRDVPSCPGWTVRDLLSHVIGVYRHKSEAMRTDAAPVQRGEDDWGVLREGEDPRAALREAYAELRALLTAREPSATTWTWWPGEQTVGFWVRRMAQETAVHRWDGEAAAYGVEGASGIDDDLADDGIDELLGWMRWDWTEVPQPAAAGQQVLVSTGEHAWTLTLEPTAVRVEGGAAEASALLAGDASSVLLHLWGRPGQDVATGGDSEALALLRERLAMAAS